MDKEMVGILILIAALALMVQAFAGFTFFVSSIFEKEKRATLYGGIQFLVILAVTIIFFFLAGTGFFETGPGLALLIGGLFVGALACLLLVTRTGGNPRALEGAKGLIVGEVKKPDEREIVFARNRYLFPGMEEYEEFYKQHPELERIDAKTRENGGPLARIMTIDVEKPAEAANKAAILASAMFTFQYDSPDTAKRSPMGMKLDLDPAEAAERVKGYARNLGADLVGIAEINPLWFYSHRGMSAEDWGKELEIEHKYAIVFANEMKNEMLGPGPRSPADIESLQRYSDGIFIATNLSSFIANLGYSTTSNYVSHYEAVLPPLAVDAGLGELGRIGYLMTKEFGPRVRLAAVTTDMPLKPDKPVDIGVEDFCKICEKCATCCPSQSIPLGDPAVVNGGLRWKLNAETCFDFWGKVGSGCAICMRVCPWSHDRTFPHKVITELVSRNRNSRRLFNLMDDVFYGKKPATRPAPDWARFEH
jgi:reductive dehalogenase